MKLYINVIILLLFNVANAQKNNAINGKVEYEMNANFGKPILESWVLYFNEEKSVFIPDNSLKLLDKNGATYDQIIQLKTTVVPHIIVDFSKDSIYNQGMVLSKPYYIKDQLYSPKWTLIKEFKTIGEYKCQKATTTFRGRKYIAWFCVEIPVNFGPWKLNGLPGLILEIEDDLRIIHMIAKSIVINSAENFDFSCKSIPKSGMQLSMKEYIVLKDKEGEEIRKFILSKQNRDTDIQFSDDPVKRSGFELRYEWEADEKK